MRIGKFYPVKSNKLLQIHDYIDIIASDKNGQDVILKCEIEDVVQNDIYFIYKIFVPYPYKSKL